MASIIKVDQIQTAAGGTPTAADLGLNVTGGVLQVVSYSTDSQVTNTTTSFVDAISGTITPTSATSKILVQFHGTFGHGVDSYGGARFYRDGSPIHSSSQQYVANSSQYTFAINRRDADGPWEAMPASAHYLDSPATTSQITYALKFHKAYGTILTFNRADNQAGSAYNWNTTATLTLIEIAG